MNIGTIMTFGSKPYFDQNSSEHGYQTVNQFYFLNQLINQKMRRSFVYRSKLHSYQSGPIQTSQKSPIPTGQKLKMIISNLETRYQLKYGMDFNNFLDARDQVLQHQFKFEFDLNQEDLSLEKGNFLETELFRMIKEKIREFMAESVGNIVSAAFKFLCKRDLEEKESMEFAAKNILLNLHSIYKATMKEIELLNIIKEKQLLEDVREHLIIQIDDILNDVLQNLADWYPQAPPSGGTPRMRQVITDVNRTDDEENDFIFTSGIKIRDYLNMERDEDNKEIMTLQEDGDYTEFIMKVINAAIEVTEKNVADARERTVYQKFTQFNQHLFWLTQHRPYQVMVSKTDQKNKLQREEKEKIEKVICKKFDNILSNQNVKEEIPESGDEQVTQEMNSIWDQSEEGIEFMKENRKFLLGQKIPASVKPFDKQEISNKQFTSKHASVLRTLTKWAGYLQQIFQDPEQYIKRRFYPFRDIKNKLVYLGQDQEGSSKLVRRLEQEYVQIKKKYHQLLRVSYGYIGKFLSTTEEKTVGSSVARFSQTRIASSKISAILTSLMLNYTNILIHHLLKAGENIMTATVATKQYHNINLILFRVSDLMRSKYQCSESDFISVLKTMYLLDDSDLMINKFKLVRIKNKLDESANNIMINYLFMGKVQCELQLSIQEAKGKEKNYYTFSHFIYQLLRDKFGSIAGCSTMMSQLDPMITACKHTYYRQKDQEVKLTNMAIDTIKNNSIQTKVYQCSQCNNLVVDEWTNKFLSRKQQFLCYSCINRKDKPEQLFKSSLKETFGKVHDRIIRNYSAINAQDKEKLMVQVHRTGQITLYLVKYRLRQFKTFLVKIDLKLLSLIDSPDFDHSQFSYIDISKDVVKNQNQNINSVLAYLFDNTQSIPTDILDIVGIKRQELDDKMGLIISQFMAYRRVKLIVKNIKFKAEIIKLNIRQFPVMDKVCRLLVLKEPKRQDQTPLRYNKFKNLDLSNVSMISARHVGLKQIPHWVRQCRNLQRLELDFNNIATIKRGQLPQFMVSLSLWNSGLTSVDISDLTYLQSAELSHNRITDFQHGNNPDLKQLRLANNRLTEFDIGANTSIQSLHLSQNKLSSIKLNNVKIKELHIGSNRLQNITEFPLSLQTLYADKKAVINFDFRQFVNLSTLGVFAKKEVSRQEINNLDKDAAFKYYSRVQEYNMESDESDANE